MLSRQMTARRNKSVTIARRLPRSNVDLAVEYGANSGANSGANWALDSDSYTDFSVAIRTPKEEGNQDLKTSSSGKSSFLLW